MSEDAPVNTGAVAWPDDFTASVMVRRMQTKLHLWAARDAGRRFDDLFNLVYDPAFLVVAWERVSTNKGASTPGIDKVTAAGVEARDGVLGLLGRIREELKSGSFRPVEVRRVLIPKSNGKLRKLGIPVPGGQSTLVPEVADHGSGNCRERRHGTHRSGPGMKARGGTRQN